MKRMIDGTSAQLTNQSLPDAAVRGVDHPAAVRSEKRSVDVSPFRSIQLRSTPRVDEDSCGCPLFGPAGEGMRSIEENSEWFEPFCAVTVAAAINSATAVNRSRR